MVRNITSKRDGNAHILTITAGDAPNTQLKVDNDGHMTDLSGAAVTKTNMTIAVLHFRNQGKRDVANSILNWWSNR